ncbi:MAG: ABC-F family ATP-binding cassette domain-containing protein [Saprospiraceae bacterium]|nr:ABC-F family ATP-binding cassette domain-containing protein [Saprospiraceae bacterium]
MNYLTLENVSKSYGDKVLFNKINLQISKGQKIALVAKNGSGKSTLLRVIGGQEAPEGETAKILVRKDIKIGFLDQEPDFFDEHTVFEAVFDSENAEIQAIKAYEEALRKNDNDALQLALDQMDKLKAWDIEAKVKELLTRFNIGDFEKKVKQLSGGQKKRLALVKLVIEAPEFIIMDEPTNHLDIDMIEWLEEYLQRANLTLLMVTHDRYFLERVCDVIIELDHGEIFKYNGNYSDFLTKKAIRHETESAEMEKTKKLFKRELDWVRRSPQARSTKAKARVDAFYDIKDKVSQKRDNTEMQIDIKGQRLGKKIVEMHNVYKSFGDLKLIKGFDYKFRKKERVGIVGPNGVGKSTFLQVMTGQLRPDGGKVVVGGNTVFGYYTQSGIQLRDDKRVIDVVQDIAEYIPLDKGQKLTAPQLLERFLFSRKQQQVYVSQLSGGERRRLYLLTVLMENPNFLILDEPTNDLDILTLNVLEDFLLEFPGCVIIVTHDRYFMDKLVDHLFVFKGDGIIKDFNGDYTDYREMIKVEEREQRKLEREEQLKQKAKEKAAEAKQPGLSQEEKKELKRLEKQIAKLEEKKEELSERFNSTDISPEQIEEWSKELSAVTEELEEKEMRWMELADMA